MTTIDKKFKFVPSDDNFKYEPSDDIDCFSLFDALEPSDDRLNEMKDFLTRKFYISFDEIIKDISERKNTSSIVDCIYDSVSLYTRGFSLDTFCDTTYMEYSHGNTLLKPNHPLLAKCNEQVKYYCLISSLYTIYAIYNRDNYKKLFEVAMKYQNKIYLTFDVQNILSSKFYYGYEKYNHKIEERLRSAYDSLCIPIKSKNKGKEDINSKRLLFSDEYLRKAFNFKKDGSRLLSVFLEEFSFDLIVNQMQGGFHLISKMETLQKYRRQKSPNFRREINRFLNGLKIIDNNFKPTNPSKIESLLYYWKRESLFHINIFKYLTNTKENEILLKYASDFLAFPTLISLDPFISVFKEILQIEKQAREFHFIMRYLTEITFPVYVYTFFIVLCEYFHYSLEDIRKELSNYIESLSIKMESFDAYSLNTDFLKREKADSLGEAILDTFSNAIRLPYFDNSFMVNLNYINSDKVSLYLNQSSLGLAYYLNILQ